MSVDLSVKVSIVGNVSVGKTHLAHYLTSGKPPDPPGQYEMTIGVSFSGTRATVQSVRSKDWRVGINLWDATGMELFRSLTRDFYRNSAIVLVVFDVTDRKSWEMIPDWLGDVRDVVHPAARLVLVGNKVDLLHGAKAKQRAVSRKAAKHFAKTHGLQYHETSGHTGYGMDTLLLESLRTIIARMDLYGRSELAQLGIKNDYYRLPTPNVIHLNNPANERTGCAPCIK